MSRSAKSSPKTVAFLLLFALPFAGVGLFGGWMVASDLMLWMRARSWTPVQARLLEVGLEENRGDSTTYRVVAEYAYTIDGREFVGTRVGLSTAADNIGDWHSDTHRELEQARRAGRTVVVRVDPADPEQAILRPEMRWGLLMFKALFMAVFGIVGFGLMAAGIFGGRIQRRRSRLEERHPDEPWRWRPEWNDGRLTTRPRARTWSTIALALLWNLISAPVLFFVPAEVRDGNTLALVALVFPLVGIGLAWTAVASLLRWRRFGSSTLLLDGMPPRIGGLLRGRLQTGIPLREPLAPRLRLNCVRERTTGSGKNRSTRRDVLWQDEIRLPARGPEPGPRGAVLPIEIQLPDDAPPTSFDPAAEWPIEWTLEVDVELDGIDYAASFELPVAERDPSALPATTSEPDSDPEPGAELEPARLAERGIQVATLADGSVRMVFDRARHKLPAAGLAAFTAIWAGAIWLLLTQDGPLLMVIAFGLCVPFLLWGLAEMLLARYELIVGRDGIRHRRGFFRAGRERRIPAAELAEIRPARGMQAGRRLYWRIEAARRDGSTELLTTRIADLRTARGLIGWMRRVVAPPDGP